MTQNEQIARFELDIAVAFNLLPRQKAAFPLVKLTDDECAAIAADTIYSFQQIRAIYPKRENFKR